MSRETLERHQVWCYLLAVLAGLALGFAFPDAAPLMEALLWPGLAALLYATFTQVPLARLGAAFRARRLMAAVLLGNFVVLLAWVVSVAILGVLLLIADDGPQRETLLGWAGRATLVLVVWFVAGPVWEVFSDSAKGDDDEPVDSGAQEQDVRGA